MTESRIVRESKFRNIFSKTWKKELFYTNLKVNLSGGGEDLFKANAKFFAVPWTTAGGGVAVIGIANAGKAPDSQPLLSGHTDGITAIDFSPFDDHILATGSRDNTVKIWKVPPEGLTTHITTPQSSLFFSKKVTTLQFHPTADNLLFTAAGDFSAKIWDVEKSADMISLAGHTDMVSSITWNVSNGAALAATACKDKMLRIYDPRASPKAVQECAAHEGVQGFRAIWADSNDFNFLLSVGFSKGSERSASLWDPRKLGTALHSSQISGIPGSSALIPFYDPATNVVFFSGKGDLITFYELDRFPPQIHLLNKAQFASTHSTICALPKRVCDAGMCEIDRFLRLTNNVVEVVSFIVPRKTQATHFQADIFPPAPSGEPALSSEKWLAGACKPLPTVSMKPAHLPEDAPVSLASSSSSVPSTSSNPTSPVISPVTSPIIAPNMAPAHAGPMLLEVKGWFLTAYEPKYFSVTNQTLYCFVNKDSAEAIFSVPVSTIQETKVDPNHASRFSVVSPTATYNVEAYNAADREKWLKALTIKQSASTSSAQELISGNLTQHVSGYFWDTNELRRFIVSGGVLSGYKLIGGVPDTSLTVESIYLEKVIGLHATEAVFDIPGFSFQISTATRILHLLAQTQEDRGKWLKVLGKVCGSGGSGSGGSSGSTFVSRSTFISNAARAGYTPGNFGTPTASPALDSSAPPTPTSAPTSPTPGGDAEATSEYVDDIPPSTQIVLNGWGQRRTNGLYGMLGLWGKCYISLIGEDLFLFKDMRSTAPDLRLQLGNVVGVKLTNPQIPLEFQIELPGGVIHYFRATTAEECTAWVEALNSSRKRAASVTRLLSLVKEGEFDEEEAKKNKNLIEPHLLKTGQQKILMQIKGKRRVRVCTVAVSPSSLNTNNAFVLDAGTHIYLWLGERSSRVTRAKALDLAGRIRREERSSRSDIVNIEEGKTDNNEAFWKALGGTKPSPTEAMKAAQAAQKASDQDKDDDQTMVYWVGCDPGSGVAQIQVVDECINRLPKKEILNTTGVFVVDTGTEVFCWVGKASGARPRKHGLRIALGLAEGRKHVLVERVLEFGEPNLFKEKFANYPGMLPISTTKQESKRNIAVSRIELKVQELVQRMFQVPPPQELDPIVEKLPEESRMTIWRIEEFEKVAVPRDLYGHFFMAESYIVHYAYTNSPGGKDQHILFYFLGRDCPTNDKGTAAYLTVELDETLGSNSTQIRVVQDKEPSQFLAIFKGKYVVHAGKFADYKPDSPAPRLYDIRGKDALHAHAVETEMKCSNLHNAHAFVLRSPANTFIWCGKHSQPHVKTCAHTTGSIFSERPTLVSDGREPPNFWELLGGKGNYFNFPALPPAPPRLFICSQGTGRVDVEQEEIFAQEDLTSDTVALLDDSVGSVYIWLGKRSSHTVRKVAMEVAIEYANRCKAAGGPRKVFVVHAFHEPHDFKAHFRSWSQSKYPKAKTPTEYDEWPAQPVEEVLQHYLREVYSYQELLSDTLPPGIDVKKLESYLSDEEFEKVFHMTRQEFDKVPVWKKEGLKKEVYLF